jgi:hypothetical protein
MLLAPGGSAAPSALHVHAIELEAGLPLELASWLLDELAVFTLPQTVKLGVQYSLWGGSVLNLGTERHRRKYFDDIDRFRLPGGACWPGLQILIAVLLTSALHLCWS